MKITGTYTIAAPREQVWAALNDIAVLARIVPGCERLEQTGEHEYEGTIKIGIQAIKGTYQGRIRIEDLVPPQHYRLIASGRSAHGVVDGSGTIDLEEQEGATLLTYTGDAQIGGTLASVGQRLIEGASRQLLNQSLKALVEQITIRSTSPDPATNAPVDMPTTPTTEHTAPEPQASTATDGPSNLHPPTPPPLPPAPPPAFERRAVIVPEHEQLKPTAIARGAVADFSNERPWLPWVIIAFLLGVLLGRTRRPSS